MNDHYYAPFAAEKMMLGIVLLMFGYVLAQRSVELVERRRQMGSAMHLVVLHVFLIAYLALPLGLKLPERFASIMTPFANPIMFLFLCIISYAGAVGLYRVLGGKPKRDQEQYR
ncbi:hypothetical protein M1D58_27510 (plasmid) [Pseudomonas sp. R4-76]|uniref:hypothetical protein n=1 Tax=unclassified Pseudomonas TaxID=196821 RepID=UPI003DAA239F